MVRQFHTKLFSQTGQATGNRCLPKSAGVSQSAKVSQNQPASPSQLESQDHLGLCQGYADLRQGLDLDTDEDLLEFLRQVMAIRERQGWD